jgi:hypothetical protein
MLTNNYLSLSLSLSRWLARSLSLLLSRSLALSLALALFSCYTSHFSSLKNIMLGGLIGPEAVARRILEKVAVATLDEDRRAGLLELKEKAAVEPVAVGKVVTGELCRMLSGFRDDVAMLRAALETLLACLNPEASVVGAAVAKEAAAANSSLFSQEDISLLLELLEEKSWSSRLSLLKIIGAIQGVKPAYIQAAILQSPQGLARLMDVLAVRPPNACKETY